MKRQTECPECGRRYDADAVRAAFRYCFDGRFDFAGQEARRCFACACLAAARGRWNTEEASAPGQA